MTPKTMDEWLETNEYELYTMAAESGRDMEGCYCPGDYAEKYYELYLSRYDVAEDKHLVIELKG